MGSEEVQGSIERTVRLPNATYTFDLGGASDDVYQLKSKTRFEVDIDGRAIDGNSGDGWDSTQVTASHSAQLVDTAFVEGVQGQTGGFIEFFWDITGGSTILVDPKLAGDAYRINELFTTTFFNTLEENAAPELLINDQSNPGLGQTVVDSRVEGSFEPVVVAVDWLVGEEIDVFFELKTAAALGIMNLDAAGFEATLETDFSNTATMMAINIYDENGDLLEDARLVGEGGFVYDPPGVAIPEPSSAAILLGVGCLFAARRRRARILV